MSEPPNKKKHWSAKRTDLVGWNAKSTPDCVQKMQKHKVVGDWRWFGITAHIKWEKVQLGKVVTLMTPVPVGMKNVLIKMENAQNRVYNSLPIAVKEELEISSQGEYNPQDYSDSDLQ